MSIFLKKKKGNLKENGFSGEPDKYFKVALEKRKVKLAGWLSRKTSRYSPLQKKIGLIIFCILFGSLSFLILARSVYDRGYKSHFLILHHLRSGMSPAHPHISDSAFVQIERAKHFLDSLRNNDTLKFRVILLNRPALLNNLQMLEKIYQYQNR